MFKQIKFLFQKIFSSKFIIKGSCKCCGNCCKNIVFFIGKHTIRTEKEFINMKNFDKRYNNFEINGKGENGELLFKCKALKENGKCGMYFFRSIKCRLYPYINQQFAYKGGELLDGCGYYIDIDKKFEEYLKK